MAGPTGMGSSALGTGLAAAGGFAAGMMAEKLLQGSSHEGERRRSDGDTNLSPGLFDSGTTDDALSSRAIDFGSGSDWGDGGGGDDGGGDGDGGGW